MGHYGTNSENMGQNGTIFQNFENMGQYGNMGHCGRSAKYYQTLPDSTGHVTEQQQTYVKED